MHYTDDELANLAQQWTRITQAARDHHWQAMDEATQKCFRDLVEPPAGGLNSGKVAVVILASFVGVILAFLVMGLLWR